MSALTVLALVSLGVYEGTFLDGDAHRIGETNFLSGGVKVSVEKYVEKYCSDDFRKEYKSLLNNCLTRASLNYLSRLQKMQ